MATSKTPAHPLFAHKHEFVRSLDNFIQASLNLYQSADILKTTMPPNAQASLQKHLDAWRAATFRPEEKDADT
jgi:hypothetical protein